MKKQTTIHICSDEMSIEVVTEKDITFERLKHIERQLNAIINENLYHDLRGRITSVNLSLHMLEKVILPEAQPRFQLLKLQLEDLTQIIDGLN